MGVICIYIDVCDTKIDRQWVSRYCIGDYRKCPIYRRRIEPDKKPREWLDIINEEKAIKQQENKLNWLNNGA